MHFKNGSLLIFWVLKWRSVAPMYTLLQVSQEYLQTKLERIESGYLFWKCFFCLKRYQHKMEFLFLILVYKYRPNNCVLWNLNWTPLISFLTVITKSTIISLPFLMHGTTYLTLNLNGYSDLTINKAIENVYLKNWKNIFQKTKGRG